MFLRRPGRPPLAFGGLAFFLLKYGVEDQVDSWVFRLPIVIEQLPKTAIVPNGPRVYEPEVRARRLRL